MCWKTAFELSCFVHFIGETKFIPMVMGSSSGIDLGLHHMGIFVHDKVFHTEHNIFKAAYF